MARSTAVEPSVLGLKRSRLLARVPDSALEEIARQCRWLRFAAGQRAISREAPDNDVYLVISGKVRVTSYSGAGHEVSFGTVGAGEWFGDFAAIDGLSRSADVLAVEDTLAAAMTPALFRRLVHDHPAVCDCMLQRLVGAIRQLTDRVVDFSTLDVRSRVSAELLRLARQAGVERNQARIDPAPRHADLASRISTYREQVTRELSALAKQGLVQRAKGAIVIPDVQRLERAVSERRRST